MGRKIPVEIRGDEAKEACFGTIDVNVDVKFCRVTVECPVVKKCIVTALREELGREPTEKEVETSMKSIDEAMG